MLNVFVVEAVYLRKAKGVLTNVNVNNNIVPSFNQFIWKAVSLYGNAIVFSAQWKALWVISYDTIFFFFQITELVKNTFFFSRMEACGKGRGGKKMEGRFAVLKCADAWKFWVSPFSPSVR